MIRAAKISINNTTSLQAFQLIRYVALMGISIFFTKWGLSREEIGIFETVLFISGLLSTFWISGLIQAMLPLVKSNQHDKEADLFNAFVVIVIFALITLAIGLIFEPNFRQLDSISHFEHYRLAILYTAISAPGYIIEYIYLLKNQFKNIIRYGLIIFSIQIIAVCLAVVLRLGMIGAVYALLLVSVLKLIWALVLVLNHSQLSFSRPFIQRFLALGFPLIGKIFLSGSASYIDGLIIASRFNLASFAIYRYGARDLPLVTLMANGLSNSMLPEFSIKEKLYETMRRLKERTLWHMHILFPITIVTILLSKPLFPIVFNPDFSASAEIFMIYLLTINSKMLFPQTVAIGLGKTKALLSISLLELVVHIALSLLFVQFWGIAGVAWAALVAFWIEKFAICLYLYFRLGIKPSAYTPLKAYALYNAFTVIVFTAAYFWL